MSIRQFAVVMKWAWDHSHREVATFSIEGTLEEERITDSPIHIHKPLTAQSFRQYYEKHKETIKIVLDKLCKAVNGNPMGETRPVALYEVARHSYELNPDVICGEPYLGLKLSEEMLCTFDRDGNIVLPKEEGAP